MVSESMQHVLARAVDQLTRLCAFYELTARQAPSPVRELATLLSRRERETIDALGAWVVDGAKANETWIRQGAPFPYRPPVPELPRAPDVRTLTEIATQTDEQLRALFERFRTYAAAEGTREGVGGLLVLLDGRDRRLSAALRELQQG